MVVSALINLSFAANPTAAGTVLGHISSEVSSNAAWVEGTRIVGSAQQVATGGRLEIQRQKE